MRCLLLSLMLAPAFAQNRGPEDWITLFNGKDLTGWKIGGDAGTFRIEDGAMVTRGQVAHAFYDGPVHDFKNFELSVDVMAEANSNGGIYFHTEFQGGGFPRKGFEVQVNNTYNVDPIKTGSLYHVQDVGTAEIKDREWYTTNILVRGDRVTVRINGKTVVEWTQTPLWDGGREGPGRVIGHGTIALQGHDAGSTVHYKNIRIRPLP